MLACCSIVQHRDASRGVLVVCASHVGIIELCRKTGTPCGSSSASTTTYCRAARRIMRSRDACECQEQDACPDQHPHIPTSSSGALELRLQEEKKSTTTHTGTCFFLQDVLLHTSARTLTSRPCCTHGMQVKVQSTVSFLRGVATHNHAGMHFFWFVTLYLAIR